MAHQTKQEPKVKKLRITVAAPIMEEALAKLKSATEKLNEIGINVGDLVDKAISAMTAVDKAISAMIDFGAVLKEMEASGEIRIEIKHKSYGYDITVTVKGDYYVSIWAYRDVNGNYEVTLNIFD